MSTFGQGDIALYKSLCAVVLDPKATTAKIQSTGKKVGGKASMPPDQQSSASPYVRLCRLAKDLNDGDTITRQLLCDLAYEVITDLARNCGVHFDSSAKDYREAVMRWLNHAKRSPQQAQRDVARAYLNTDRKDVYG
jgi:hypothetical protein